MKGKTEKRWQDDAMEELESIGKDLYKYKKHIIRYTEDLIALSRQETLDEAREKLLEDIEYWSNVSDIDGGESIAHLKLIPKELVKRNIKTILDTLKEKKK